MIVVMPIGGLGKRFAAAGATFPKILQTVRNRPMLQWAVESLNFPWAKHLFVCNQEDVERYPMKEFCAQLTPHQELVIETERKGAAPAILLALEAYGNTGEELVIANSDQWLQWDSTAFLREAWKVKADGAIPVFSSAHPKWSFARIEGGRVVEVAEKRPISPFATVGIYFWKSTRRFGECARAMMESEEKKIKGEWYVCPIYNELIAQGGVVVPYDKLSMWGLGTPEDLDEFRTAICSGHITHELC